MTRSKAAVCTTERQVPAPAPGRRRDDLVAEWSDCRRLADFVSVRPVAVMDVYSVDSRLAHVQIRRKRL